MKNLLLCLVLTFFSQFLSAQCTIPDPLPCNDQIIVNLDRIDGTVTFTPELALPRGLDACVYDAVEVVTQYPLDCSAVYRNGVNYAIHPVGDPQNFLCFGEVVIEDKAGPVIEGCPTTNLYRSLLPNTSDTIVLEDLGVSAVDNCTASPTLFLDPELFIFSSADNNDTVYAYIIAEDEFNNVTRCRVGVAVTVDNCSSGEAPPENLAVALVGSDVVFSWDEVTGFTDYAISLEEFSRKNGSGKWKTVKGIPPSVTATTYAIPLNNLVVNSLHRFSVEVSGGGNNCRAVIEFLPSALSGTPLIGRSLKNQAVPIAAQDFRIFPNPASGLLQLQFTEALPTTRRIRLMDLQGQAVRELIAGPEALTARIELEGLPAGVYIVQVQGGGGTVAKKVLIQK